MEIRNLYKYKDRDLVIFSLIKPEGVKYETHYRLIADEGKALTQDGIELYTVIDVEFIDGWYEVDYKEEDDDYYEY